MEVLFHSELVGASLTRRRRADTCSRGGTSRRPTPGREGPVPGPELDLRSPGKEASEDAAEVLEDVWSHVFRRARLPGI